MGKPEFYKLKVKTVNKETPDTVSVTFDLPAELKPKFDFTQGQYLTLKKEIKGQDVRRSYSICTSPLDQKLAVAIKWVEGGLFSTYANQELQAGDSLEVMQPMGKFYSPLDPQNENNYVAFAAGSGITPMLSIIKTTLQTEAKSTFTLFFGNRNIEHIIFREEIEALKNKYLGRFSVHHILSRENLGVPLYAGRIDQEKATQLIDLFLDPPQISHCFICGPEEMIFAVKEVLMNKGVEESKIHFELFTSPLGKLGKKKKEKSYEGPKFDSTVAIIMDGDQFDFGLSSNGEPILDAAQKATGADLPFACKGGVCCTCKAKLLEGQVEMDVNYGLEPDEIEAGYILTCQAHPRTEKVLLSFDD